MNLIKTAVRVLLFCSATAVFSPSFSQKTAEQYFNKGFHYLRHDLDEAISLLGKAIALDSAFAEAWYYRGIARYKTADYLLAATDFRMAEELDPGLNLIPVYKGFLFRQLGQYDSALFYFNDYVMKNPQDTTAYTLVMTGKMRTRLGDFEGAITDFERAVDLDPVQETYHYYKYLAYFEKGEFGNALKQIDKALELNPTFYGYYLYKGKALHELGRYAQAISQYEIAIDLNSSNGDLYYQRGLSAHALKNYKEAIDDYNTAIAYNDKDGTYYFQRGHSWMALGDRFKACNDWYTAGGLGYYEDFAKIKKVCE